ncbi:MAG: hypothetical protein ACJ8AW_28405 [Rhodopila sp.]
MLVRTILRVTGFRTMLLAYLALPIGVVTTQAQQTTGVPGSPDATTTIGGHVLSPPPQPFTGQIELNAAQSRPAWPARVVPPKDAPNILLIMTDDVGFGAGRTVLTYTAPITGIPRGTAPSLINTSYTITAEIDVPQDGAEGMIVTDGGRFGDYGLYLAKGKPVLTWNLLDLKRMRWEGPALSPDRHTLEYDFAYDGLGFATLAYNNISGLGRSGTGVLRVDGKDVTRQTMERTTPLTLPIDETFDIGSDTGTPVDDRDYQVPFSFTGRIDKLTITLERPKLTPEDVQKLEAGYRAEQDAN